MRGSSLPLLTKCPGSTFLPTDDTPFSDEAVKATEWGTMVHKWKETGDVTGPDKRTENALKRAIATSGIDRVSLWPNGGTHESSVALRVDGVREVRQSHDGVFGTREWVTGTADFYWYLYDGDLWIDDLKTGKSYPDPITGENRFPQDPRSAQLKFYALAIALLTGHNGVVHISVTHWPRLPLEARHSPPDRLWATFTTDDLDQFYGELEQLYKDQEAGYNGDFRLYPGDHCKFCPSRTFCLVAQPFEERRKS